MKMRVFRILAAVAVLFALAGCGDYEPPGSPSSMDAYTSSEPRMENPHRVAVRVGQDITIEIPDYFLPPPSADGNYPMVTAKFFIPKDDDGIAQIVSTPLEGVERCIVRGKKLGNTQITITMDDGRKAVVFIAVVPVSYFYEVSNVDEKKLGSSTWWTADYISKIDYPDDAANYTVDPTYQLAWIWRNPTQTYGASGTPCGIDLVSYFVDPTDSTKKGWAPTTYGFGGWHYDLNGESDTMKDGVQVKNGIELKLKPQFIYDNGVPYLQITHVLTNTNPPPVVTPPPAEEDEEEPSEAPGTVSNLKFGASANIVILGKERATLNSVIYGALMTNGINNGSTYTNPTAKFRLVCKNLEGVDDVSTLWLGERKSASDTGRADVYKNATSNVYNKDTVLNFSYQGIKLAPGESKEFVIRLTQVQ